VGLPSRASVAGKLAGVAMLVGTTVLWGTSFSFIKLSVGVMSSLEYTSYRCLIATTILAPAVLVKAVRGEFSRGDYLRGLAIGVAYALGLLLQGEGTRYTTPSISAFLTALNSINVHLYVALVEKRYHWLDALALLLAVSGLYAISMPSGGLGVGELLILLGSVAWAAQIILVSKYGRGGIVEILAGTFTPGALLSPLAAAVFGNTMNLAALAYLAYLAVICSIGATFLQVLGQRRVSPLAAAVIFLLEPVFATLFSLAMGLEELTLHKAVGGGLIVASTYIATYSEIRYAKY